MFAVFKTGGKQYRVQDGDVLRVEKLSGTAGDKIQFNTVLMIGGKKTEIGTPTVNDAAVQAEILDQIKGDKVITFVKRRRKHSSKRTRGHRQQLTLLKITSILATGGAKSGLRDATTQAPEAPISEKTQARPKAKPAAKATARKAEPKAKPAAKAATETTEPKAKAEPKKAAVKKPAAPEKPAPKAKATKTAGPAVLKAARKEGPDPLDKLKGVGPKMVEKLNEAGIFHFDQIAGWTGSDIQYMDEKLGARGKIEKDDWVALATALAQNKE